MFEKACRTFKYAPASIDQTVQFFFAYFDLIHTATQLRSAILKYYI